MAKENFTFTNSHFVFGVILCLLLFTSWKDPPTVKKKNTNLFISFKVKWSKLKYKKNQKPTHNQNQK